MNTVSRRNLLELMAVTGGLIATKVTGIFPELVEARAASAGSQPWRELTGAEYVNTVNRVVAMPAAAIAAGRLQSLGFQQQAGGHHAFEITRDGQLVTGVVLLYRDSNNNPALLSYLKAPGYEQTGFAVRNGAEIRGYAVVGQAVSDGTRARLVNDVLVVKHPGQSERQVPVGQLRRATPNMPAYTCSDCNYWCAIFYGVDCAVPFALGCLGCALLGPDPAVIICGVICAVLGAGACGFIVNNGCAQTCSVVGYC